MSTIQIDGTPLLKILLHAAKYPSATLNGLLLGRFSESSDSSADTAQPSTSGPIHIVDAVPLFHTYLHLAMPLETAFLQVNTWAQSQNLQVVGLYHANERLDDRQLAAGPKTIADKLRQQCYPGSCVLLVDNERMGSFLRGTDSGFLELYTKDGGSRSWSPAAGGSAKLQYGPGNLPDLYVKYVGEGRHRKLSDFDDHFDDLARDWTNAQLLS